MNSNTFTINDPQGFITRSIRTVHNGQLIVMDPNTLQYQIYGSVDFHHVNGHVQVMPHDQVQQAEVRDIPKSSVPYVKDQVAGMLCLSDPKNQTGLLFEPRFGRVVRWRE